MQCQKYLNLLNIPRLLLVRLPKSSFLRYNHTASDYDTNETKVHDPELETESDESHDKYDIAYPGHIQTSFFQKALLSAGSAAVAITAPWRGDMVATLGETTGYPALKYMHSKMMNDPVGKLILQERPRINGKTVDLDNLATLPEGTFGKEYINFLKNNGNLHPDERPPVHFVDDPELAYVMMRYRETHDLFHVLLGMPTHMLGEVVVKVIEGIQTGLPMCVTGGLFGPLRLGPKHIQKYRETHLWWALRTGYNAKFLLNVYYEKEWETDIDQLRAFMNIEPPPPTPKLMNKKS